jgi:hypothetical protein
MARSRFALALGLGVLVLAVLGFVLVNVLGGDEEKPGGVTPCR